MELNLEKAKSYRVVARLEETARGYQIYGTYRGKLRLKGVVHLHFEGSVWEHLVQAQYIDEVEEVKRGDIY